MIWDQGECIMGVLIRGKPIGKQRHRMSGGRAYTPRETAKWERDAAWVMAAAARDRRMNEPLVLVVGARFALARTAKHSIGDPHCAKPDLDNIVKIVMDSIVRARIVDDDRYIATIRATKTWSDENGVIVALFRLAKKEE